MKSIMKYVLQQKNDYGKLPFFDYLRDETLSARDRLAFYPCMAHFILSFGDLNRYVLMDRTTTDPYQKIINSHALACARHWSLYLEDFTKLGLDGVCAPSDVLRFLWSNETSVNRLLSTRLAYLVYKTESKLRLAIIGAIEETSNILFALTTPLAGQIAQETGQELRYLGDFHFALQTDHAMGGALFDLLEIELNEDEQQRAIALVNEVFALFIEWTEELHRFVKNQLQMQAQAHVQSVSATPKQMMAAPKTLALAAQLNIRAQGMLGGCFTLN